MVRRNRGSQVYRLQRLFQPQFYAVEAPGAPLPVGELVRRLRLEQPTTR